MVEGKDINLLLGIDLSGKWSKQTGRIHGTVKQCLLGLTESQKYGLDVTVGYATTFQHHLGRDLRVLVSFLFVE